MIEKVNHYMPEDENDASVNDWGQKQPI